MLFVGSPDRPGATGDDGGVSPKLWQGVWASGMETYVSRPTLCASPAAIARRPASAVNSPSQPQPTGHCFRRVAFQTASTFHYNSVNRQCLRQGQEAKQQQTELFTSMQSVLLTEEQFPSPDANPPLDAIHPCTHAHHHAVSWSPKTPLDSTSLTVGQSPRRSGSLSLGCLGRAHGKSSPSQPVCGGRQGQQGQVLRVAGRRDGPAALERRARKGQTSQAKPRPTECRAAWHYQVLTTPPQFMANSSRRKTNGSATTSCYCLRDPTLPAGQARAMRLVICLSPGTTQLGIEARIALV